MFGVAGNGYAKRCGIWLPRSDDTYIALWVDSLFYILLPFSSALVPRYLVLVLFFPRVLRHGKALEGRFTWQVPALFWNQRQKTVNLHQKMLNLRHAERQKKSGRVSGGIGHQIGPLKPFPFRMSEEDT